jgi:hypothetical protein
MNDAARVEMFLDKVAERPLTTFEAAYDVRLLMSIFPEVNMGVELRLAFRRQEKKDPEANSMRTLAQHMAAELLGFDE